MRYVATRQFGLKAGFGIRPEQVGKSSAKEALRVCLGDTKGGVRVNID